MGEPSKRIILRGGFSPISGMTFVGQNEPKGKLILDNLFNVEETQESGKNCVLVARILRTTSVSETFELRFDLDPQTRQVVKAWCSCYVGGWAKCKHAAALFTYINEERCEGKTDDGQTWHTPSSKMQERFPKGETAEQIFTGTGCSTREIYKQRPDDPFLDELANDMAMFGLTDRMLYMSLTADVSQASLPPPVEPQPVVLHPRVKAIFHSGGYEMNQSKSKFKGKLNEEHAKFYKDMIVRDDATKEDIFCKTIGQTERIDRNWFNEREFLVTASNARKLAFATSEEILLKYFNSPGIEGDNLNYGKEMEPHAINAYARLNPGFTIHQSGLVICRKIPWLAASPDSLITDDKGQLLLLEVKCPVSGRSGPLKVDFLYDCDLCSHGRHLKEGHAYYAQIQTQLMACDVTKAHLFVYGQGPDNYMIIQVERDDLFC